MLSKELIEKACNLTCSKDDMVIDQSEMQFDIDHPFKKYYDVNIIVKAIQKYECGEWDDVTLAYWANFYNWVICGGFDDNVVEELDEFENLIKEIISWDLDGLSFFDEDEDDMLSRFVEGCIDLDFILKTKDEWKYYCAYIGKNDKHNHDPYVLLVNEKEKKYMIIHGVDDCCACFSEKEHKMKKKDFIKYVEQLNEENYGVLSYAEESFYEDIGK